jgi:hypothetical protein
MPPHIPSYPHSSCANQIYFHGFWYFYLSSSTEVAVIGMIDRLGTLHNLHQLSDIRFYGCASITKLPQTIALLNPPKMFGIMGYLTAEN